MPKTLIIAIAAVIVLAVGAAFVFSGPKKETAPAPKPAAPEQAAASGAPTAPSAAQPIKDGTYAVVAADSKMEAEGRRHLIPGYVDKAAVSVKEGVLVVAGEKITADVTYDLASIAVQSTGRGSGESMLQKHLMSADFFNVEQFPTATFKLKSATVTDASKHQYAIVGDLTVKGQTNEIAFPAVAYMQDGALQVRGAVDLDRTRWGITYGSGKFFDNLADKVIHDVFTITFATTPRATRSSGSTTRSTARRSSRRARRTAPGRPRAPASSTRRECAP